MEICKICQHKFKQIYTTEMVPFPLKFGGLAKNAKKTGFKAKERFALQNLQLHKIPSPRFDLYYFQCLILQIIETYNVRRIL